jgi:acyl-CoA synthetase (AMP-forming)/AMP-acid ligase II
MAENTLAASFSDLESEPEWFNEPVDDRGGVPNDSPTGLSSKFGKVCVGTPVAGTSISITDEADHIAAQGTVGMIEISGLSLMDGYYQNDSATAASLHDGWLRTGDLGFIHQEKLYVVGRSSDVIIKGGRNLYPADIERVAADTLGKQARAVAAFARPNQETGTEDLVLAVETSESDPTRREVMSKRVRAEVLAVLGIGIDEVRPCSIGTLPRTTSGKIRRRSCASVLNNAIARDTAL